MAEGVDKNHEDFAMPQLHVTLLNAVNFTL